VKNKIFIPVDIPQKIQELFLKNYQSIVNKKGNLFLFAADQKIEHLHDDLAGPTLPEEIADPEHFFKIAKKGKIGAFATQLGLIAKYGKDYPEIPYIVKLNSKTNVVPAKHDDPLSSLLWDVEDVVTFKENSGLNICGIGYTLYLGSLYEEEMLSQAAQVVFQAHQNGLVAILWVYPRGKHIKHERDPHILAGATGVAACLGADFVKIQTPQRIDKSLQEVVRSAGRTKVICAGGPSKKEDSFLKDLEKQVSVGKINGFAIGRNIFQKTLKEAINLTKKIAKIL